MSDLTFNEFNLTNVMIILMDTNRVLTVIVFATIIIIAIIIIIIITIIIIIIIIIIITLKIISKQHLHLLKQYIILEVLLKES